MIKWNSLKPRPLLLHPTHSLTFFFFCYYRFWPENTAYHILTAVRIHPVLHTDWQSDVTHFLVNVQQHTHTHTTQRARAELLPFLKVFVVLGMVFVTGFLQSVVEVKCIFFINVDWSQVGASAEPPQLWALTTKETSHFLFITVSGTKVQSWKSHAHRLPPRSQSIYSWSELWGCEGF